ncbi:MAG: helix-turn-helix domain-containing protein [Halobacteriales archaeon]|nr:helix-turn-helix domain-containing protein [Halobacteriales archaeon]
MRSYKLKVDTDAQIFHDYEEIKNGKPMVTAVHGLKPVGDDRLGMLYEYESGDVPAVREDLDKVPKALEYKAEEIEGSVFAYVVWNPRDIVNALVDTLYSYRVIIDYPFRVTIHDELILTLVGVEEDLQMVSSVEHTAVDITVLRKGDYRPRRRDILSVLTPRQQEVLRTAVEIGYYDESKGVEYKDIAEELGVAVSTVGHHLRKVESQLLREVVSGLDETR